MKTFMIAVALVMAALMPTMTKAQALVTPQPYDIQVDPGTNSPPLEPYISTTVDLLSPTYGDDPYYMIQDVYALVYQQGNFDGPILGQDLYDDVYAYEGEIQPLLGLSPGDSLVIADFPVSAGLIPGKYEIIIMVWYLNLETMSGELNYSSSGWFEIMDNGQVNPVVDMEPYIPPCPCP